MARIQARKRKDGTVTYTVTIRIKGYPIETATFDRKTDAKIWAQEIETAMRKGKHSKTSQAKKKTLADTIDRYIQNELPHRKSDHQKFKMQLSWWKEHLGSYFLADITPSILAEYRDKLQKEPSSRGNKPRTNATVNRYMASLSIVLSITAREWEWIESNPMLKVNKKKEDRGRIRFLSDEERNALLHECEKATNPLIYLLVVIALSTGARYSEVINLKWENIDFKRKVFYFMDTKNSENRAVPISKKAFDLLTEHNKIRKINSNYVFARSDGKKPIDLRHQWEESVKRAGLEDFRFHDLRHTAASYLAMNGATLVEISDILGHKTMQMVKRYSHLTQQHTAGILERMNDQQFGNMQV